MGLPLPSSSCLNIVSLLVCVVGARTFGRATALILAAVVACTVVTAASFFRDFEYEQDFVYNATSPAGCVPSPDNSSVVNCTKVDHGVFVGVAAASGERGGGGKSIIFFEYI